MLKIHTLTLGLYQTNTYIIHEASSKSCCVIDPGYEAATILDKLEDLGLTLDAILLTHGHFDHVGAVKDLAADTDCRVFICAEDALLPPMFTGGKLYYTDTYAEGSILNIAGLYIHVLHTPGHTPGSVCLLAEDALFSGDTLFAGSCGRTDIGGDWAAIQKSLKRLASMDANFRVFPGHGESTTLAAEKRYNPYMR
jgi:glyoxylase-like metal-dependent hydrolase (beta-lactamase superfamily II)